MPTKEFKINMKRKLQLRKCLQKRCLPVYWWISTSYIYAGYGRASCIITGSKLNLKKKVEKTPNKPPEITDLCGIRISSGLLSVAMLLTQKWHPKMTTPNFLNIHITFLKSTSGLATTSQETQAGFTFNQSINNTKFYY